ncbi:hypothetical protein [Streptomyces sp. NPDC127098]|uniref:hypothetical protein n=1 Tax=Streptomyces sp. NPDC127098 TaxID=3347137 RepID=UPI00365669F6
MTLDEPHITSVHIDERGRSVTVTSRRPGLPEDALADWQGRGYTAHELSVVYSGVTDLAVDGWTHEPLTSWGTAELPDGRLAVTLAGPGTSVRFDADSPPRVERRGLITGAF